SRVRWTLILHRANVLPSGLNWPLPSQASAPQGSPPSRGKASLPVATSHTFPPATSRLPSGDKSGSVATGKVAGDVAGTLPLATSHNATVVPFVVASVWPSGLKARPCAKSLSAPCSVPVGKFYSEI